MKRFQLRPVAALPEELRSVFEGIELYLNELAVDPGTVAEEHIALRHTLMHAAGSLLGGTTTGTRAFGLTGFSLFGSNITNPLHLIRLTPDDWAVSGKTAWLRTRGTLMVNATAPGASCDFHLGLYPINSVAGASGGITYTAGSVLGEFTFNSGTALSASTPYSGESAEFDVPAAGWYALALRLSGATMAAGSHIHATARLHIHHE